MVFTQKLTSLAFSVHDGLYKDEEDLSRDQKEQAVTSVLVPRSLSLSLQREPTNNPWIIKYVAFSSSFSISLVL